MGIAAGSLLVSVVALWRSGRVRVLDRRTELRGDLADLRPRVDALERVISDAVQSRVRANSAVGLGRSGAEVMFKKAAEDDSATVQEFRRELDEIDRVPVLAGYRRIEKKMVAARTLRTRFEQLADKYAAAAREDEATRKHLRDHMTAVTAARLGRPPETP
ncbi:MAG TPA: hypothetical protein VGS41_00890 [Chthonomonadales bacterium]|nr:hypothetical protein [Chthonomonadales bacterium]